MWKIDKSWIEKGSWDKECDVNVESRGFNESEFKKMKQWRFKLLDDDGNLYYKGYTSKLDFSPLDCYGMPNAGCTTMMYYERGWNQL